MAIRFSSAPLGRLIPDDHPAALQLDLFLAYRRAAGRREATISGYQRVARRFITECPGLPAEPSQWTTDHVVRWIAQRRLGRTPAGKPLDENTIAYDQRQLYVWLGWLYERGTIERDPRRGLPVTRGQVKVKHAMTEVNVRDLVRVAGDRPKTAKGEWSERPNRLRDTAIVRVLWSTGARIKELAEMELADFDREAATVVVRHPKSNRERELPVDPQAMVALLEYLVRERDAKPGPLFHASREAIISLLKRLAERSGLRAAPHDFRYGFARRCLEAGMAQADVQDLLGHATAAMTKRYAQGAANKSAIASFRRAIG